MPDLTHFLAELGEVPSISDPLQVRRKSRDMTAVYSPVMRRELKDKFADVIVLPRHKEDVLRIAAAAARCRMPLIMRGAGTANFGQGIPLKGGAVVDMTALDAILWTRDSTIRAQAGARLRAIDEATRPTGWELRMHPSTRKVATLGGFIGGGHAGIGSCTYGILRDRGNILGLEVVSVEEQPRVVELRGDEVNLVHHAYGANGIITEAEMPLAPAWPWCETIVTFPDFMGSVRFAQVLATSDGIVKKLISLQGWPIPSLIRQLKPYCPDGHSLALCMIAEPFAESFRALVAASGGEVASWAPEGQGPYEAPIYEFAWGHTRLQVNKEDPSIIGAIGLYHSDRLVDAIARSAERFRALGGMHFEVKRFDGKLGFQGSPFFPYTDDEQLAEVMRGMAEDGAMVANNHTFRVKEGGMKSVEEADIAFKRRMDRYDLMNPGKMSFEPEKDVDEERGSGAQLPSAGWTYRAAEPAARQSAERQAS